MAEFTFLPTFILKMPFLFAKLQNAIKIERSKYFDLNFNSKKNSQRQKIQNPKHKNIYIEKKSISQIFNSIHNLLTRKLRNIINNNDNNNNDNHNGFSLKTLKNKYSESKVLIMRADFQLSCCTLIFQNRKFHVILPAEFQNPKKRKNLPKKEI